MADLLIELFSEEIPARMQARAAQDLKARMTDALVEAGLTYAGAVAHHTPRRLVLSVQGLLDQSPTLREERKGPRVDAPEKAVEGFLRGAGIDRSQLQERDDKKGRVYFAVIEHPGRPAAEIVAETLENVVKNFPWPKSMRWGAGSLKWVRPLHSILCILTCDSGEAQVVPLDIDGIKAGDTTYGHRFMAPDGFAVTSYDDYTAKLRRARVMLDADERAGHIWQEAQNIAFSQGLEVVEDKGLLAEVAGLVEWPVTLMGEIDEEFLELPPEVLQTSMKEHQKFFSVRNVQNGDSAGGIVRFITVANIETPDHGATILAGNQKVLSARLADAKFFWENDLRIMRDKGLTGMAEGLSNVTFHRKLGSQADRVARITALAREIAPKVGAKPDLAAEAAQICKADLQSEMVGEFPELQGVMGRYYAQAAGHDDGVPEACEMHYKPLGPGDTVPTEPVSVAVALADKIDTLTGFWAIDEKPTGSKDPYALRRAALGVIRLVLGNELRLSLNARPGTLHSAAHQIGARDRGDHSGYSDTNDLLAFLHDRLKVHLRDEGIRHDVIDACLAMDGNDDLTLLVKRAEALADFLKTDDGENLLQGFKRANNILTQAEEKDGVEYSFGADVKFAEVEEERALFEALKAADGAIKPAMKAEDFAAAMAAMAALRPAVDAFFEAVQVNAENPVVRRNRLNLLGQIRGICLAVADLTRVEG
ncbi:MAG: glycine--tRNA ligase subunit beta [Sediminimonas qiaohouensis]|uniref:Glycine--tRNA ligase beta subunit n=2 Tax=Sediminimonas qiaohouensis TaxID=552061 RepID=A0A7C9HC03_9RHOB|nr:glycine--tRNA ligase subunit beta [Sediminimonas qiaohouensis]MTJ05709.1 glycine--tRNA ligase subunit beta [Sediminimonas qiaohouensis]